MAALYFVIGLWAFLVFLVIAINIAVSRDRAAKIRIEAAKTPIEKFLDNVTIVKINHGDDSKTYRIAYDHYGERCYIDSVGQMNYNEGHREGASLDGFWEAVEWSKKHGARRYNDSVRLEYKSATSVKDALTRFLERELPRYTESVEEINGNEFLNPVEDVVPTQDIEGKIDEQLVEFVKTL